MLNVTKSLCKLGLSLQFPPKPHKLNDTVCHEGESFPAEKLPGNFAHDTLQRELVRPRSSLGFLNINPAFPTEGRPPPASEAPLLGGVWSIDSPAGANREPSSPTESVSPKIDPVWQPPHRQSPRAEVGDGCCWKARKLERVFSGKGIASLEREESSKIITRGCCLQLRLVQPCWVSGGLLLPCRDGGSRSAAVFLL